MQFVDTCIVELKAGNGGNGVVSWRREAHNPYGGPFGGDGGDGGDIIIIGDHNINTLMTLRNHKRITAENGENGKTKLSSGKKGKNCLLHVPLGTVVYDQTTGNKVAEILKDGEKQTICFGGKGGHGNGWFANPENKIPNLYENGDIGQSFIAKIVIKYIADVGLVGLPNAGKSTLVGAITSSQPKVANYQFTTLNPVLGICEYKDEKLIIADIPGLIEGASNGKGLGHEFLKHIERCSILIHLISLNIEDNQDISSAYKTIENELKQYNSKLLEKPIIIVANKIDCKGAESQLEQLKNSIGKKDIFVISAKNKQNTKELVDVIYKEINELKLQLERKPKAKPIKIYELKKQPDYSSDVKIIKINERVWEVKSQYLAYWSNRIPLKTNDNIIRYNQKLKNLNIEEKIKKLGGVKGDTLLIYGNELVLE